MKQSTRKKQDDRLLKQLSFKERQLQEALRQQILSDQQFSRARRHANTLRRPSQAR